MVAIFCCLVSIFAQKSILVLESSAKKVFQLDEQTGIVSNPSFIDLSSLTPGTVKGIAQVNDKIWITDQTKNSIYIFSLTGVYESSITTGLSNIRGLNVVNNEVWVSNEGSTNGATANSIVRFSKAGVNLGYYPTIVSPFDALDFGSGFGLVSSFSTNGIAKLSYDGTVSTPFVPAAVISNPEQMNFTNGGNVLVAVFSSLGSNPAGLYVFSPAGVLLDKYPVTTGSVRGAIALTNGAYLVGTSTGVYSINSVSGASTLRAAGNFQFFTKIDTSLAVNENAENSTKIYPNPVKDILNISAKKEVENVMVYSVAGRLLMQEKVTGKSIKLDVSKLSTGMYLVKIQDQSGNIQTVKMIKE